MWSKEEVHEFFKKLFGFEFTDAELDATYADLQKNPLTKLSRHGGNNIGFTPVMLQDLINKSLQVPGASIDDPKFKKIREEVIPTMLFTLLIKKLGFGNHAIVSSDVPDILLAPLTSDLLPTRERKPLAIPVELICITDQALALTSGNSTVEKIANVIISRKFGKAYVKETALLISLNSIVEAFDPQELSTLLDTEENPFHSITILLKSDQENHVFARLAPGCETYELTRTEIDTLAY